MAAPILWAPDIFGFFLQENPHAYKIPRFRGGYLFYFFLGGGGSASFISMGAEIFLWREERKKEKGSILLGNALGAVL